jgi:hypothetical protein
VKLRYDKGKEIICRKSEYKNLREENKVYRNENTSMYEDEG